MDIDLFKELAKEILLVEAYPITEKEMIGICVCKERSDFMVFIDIIQDELFITLNCHKGSEQGEFFQLVIDARTKKVIKKPPNPDIDATIAYSHIYAMMRNEIKLPSHTVAAWG